MAAAPWDAVGTRVDKYNIVKFIGQGGGGVVHEVESTDSREHFGAWQAVVVWWCNCASDPVVGDFHSQHNAHTVSQR